MTSRSRQHVCTGEDGRGGDVDEAAGVAGHHAGDDEPAKLAEPPGLRGARRGDDGRRDQDKDGL